ncbi:MAG TPA: hypothetical protein VNL73_06545 [Verrucomicrobiae bacterium]|nr:hypothetical protein [Verrucomicrobiae bacterium]
MYWKLFAIENLLRVMMHSILTVQVNANWWVATVNPNLQNKVRTRQADYANKPWHSTPGRHEIYYAFLSDLNSIITANSHLFKPIIPDIDNWIAQIELIRLPRNIVGHMNWPHKTDRQRIDVMYADLTKLIQHLPAKGIGLSIP